MKNKGEQEAIREIVAMKARGKQGHESAMQASLVYSGRF